MGVESRGWKHRDLYVNGTNNRKMLVVWLDVVVWDADISNKRLRWKRKLANARY